MSLSLLMVRLLCRQILVGRAIIAIAIPIIIGQLLGTANHHGLDGGQAQKSDDQEEL